MNDFTNLVDAIQKPAKVDRLGRINQGFSHINNNGLNPRFNLNRSPREFDTRVHFRYTEEDKKHLEKIAISRGMSVGELIRTYITWGLENEGN